MELTRSCNIEQAFFFYFSKSSGMDFMLRRILTSDKIWHVNALKKKKKTWRKIYYSKKKGESKYMAFFVSSYLKFLYGSGWKMPVLLSKYQMRKFFLSIKMILVSRCNTHVEMNQCFNITPFFSRNKLGWTSHDIP